MINSIKPSLRIVTLDHFSKNTKDAASSRMFIELLRLRVDGYNAEYPAGYLAMETADFIGTHHLFCVQNSEKELTPIAGFRIVTLENLDYYNLEASQLHIVKTSAATHHEQVITNIFEDHRRKRKRIFVASRFTISKNFRENRFLNEEVKELSAAILCQDHYDNQNAACMGSGVLRFKSHLFLEKIGFRPLQFASKALPPVKIPATDYDETLVMLFENPTQWAKNCFHKHQLTLKNRTILSFNKERLAA